MPEAGIEPKTFGYETAAIATALNGPTETPCSPAVSLFCRGKEVLKKKAKAADSFAEHFKVLRDAVRGLRQGHANQYPVQKG